MCLKPAIRCDDVIIITIMATLFPERQDKSSKRVKRHCLNCQTSTLVLSRLNDTNNITNIFPHFSGTMTMTVDMLRVPVTGTVIAYVNVVFLWCEHQSVKTVTCLFFFFFLPPVGNFDKQMSHRDIVKEKLRSTVVIAQCDAAVEKKKKKKMNKCMREYNNARIFGHGWVFSARQTLIIFTYSLQTCL